MNVGVANDMSFLTLIAGASLPVQMVMVMEFQIILI